MRIASSRGFILYGGSASSEIRHSPFFVAPFVLSNRDKLSARIHPPAIGLCESDINMIDPTTLSWNNWKWFGKGHPLHHDADSLLAAYLPK
jgi:hypothetical protein